MREISTEDEGLMCEVVTGGEKLASVTRSARRRRLELRRFDRTASVAAEDEATKRIRPGTDTSSSSESSAEGRWPAFVSHGAVSVIGRRRYMEDTVAVAPPFMASAEAVGGVDDGEGEEEDFFAVYDGHGGSRVAEVCRERMHVVLAEEVRLRRQHGEGSGVHWKEAMEASFARVDGEVTAGGADAAATAAVGGNEQDEHLRTVGSTAIVTVVGPRHIIVANCGDSRAVLSRGGVALPLSSDHKPDRPDEMERVEAAGGRVINWNGYRVLGVLATSRSIGDYYLKPYVSVEPEVTVMDRTDKDEFLILASDGLWDVVSNEVACKIARNCLNGRAASMFPESVSGSTATDAAALLVELAISRGSKDNISVVVVQLRRLKSRKV